MEGVSGGVGNPGAQNHTAGTRLGATFDAGSFTACSFGEVLQYAGAVGTVDRQRLETYLRSKWATL
jgi:hypothetical protein